jgi:hypothetical protein
MRSRVISLAPDCHLQLQLSGCKYEDSGIAIYDSYCTTESTMVVNLWGLA